MPCPSLSSFLTVAADQINCRGALYTREQRLHFDDNVPDSAPSESLESRFWDSAPQTSTGYPLSRLGGTFFKLVTSQFDPGLDTDVLSGSCSILRSEYDCRVGSWSNHH